MCGETKPLNEFPKRKSGKQGRRTECTGCYAKLAHKRYIEQGRRTWASVTLYKHKLKNHKIFITIDDLYSLAEKTECCKICGLSLDWSVGTKGCGKNKFNSPSLDRTNNELEIRKDNISIICKKCNASKQNRTLKEFVEYCKLVVKRFE